MTSLTLTIPENIKADLNRLAWINWSLLARAEVEQEIKTKNDFEKFKELTNPEKLKKVKEIISKSKFTEEDAEFFSEKVKKAMHEDLVKEGLI